MYEDQRRGRRRNTPNKLCDELVKKHSRTKFKGPPLSALPQAFSSKGAMATASTKFLLRPSAKIILREATKCCHFHCVKPMMRTAAEAWTADSAVFERHIPPVSNSNTKHKHTEYRYKLPKTCLNSPGTPLLRPSHRTDERVIFLNTPVCTFFSIASLPSRTQSAVVDSVTLKINKVNHPLALPHPLLIQQHHDYHYYTEPRQIGQRFSASTGLSRHSGFLRRTTFAGSSLTPGRHCHRDSFATSEVSRAAGSRLSA